MRNISPVFLSCFQDFKVMVTSAAEEVVRFHRIMIEKMPLE